MRENKTWQDHAGAVLASVEGFDVIECERCGFKHAVPIPNEDELRAHYAKSFIGKRPGYFEKLREDLPWSKLLHHEKYDLFERHLSDERRSILDIGCGAGLFLKTGKDRGWKTQGMEPSAQSTSHARQLGLEIIEEPLDRKHLDELGRFDVVHMHEVIEHLPDPHGTLQGIKEIVAPGGLVCIASPNDFNPLQLSFCRTRPDVAPWWISPPEHINYFDFASIQRLLDAHGFAVLEKTATFPLEFFLLMGDNYVGNGEVGSRIHKKRVALELALNETGFEPARRGMFSSFASLGLGREFVVIAAAP